MATNPEKPTLDVYSVAEIAQAARVPVSVVEALAADGRIRPVSPMHPFFDLDQAVAAVRLLHADRAQGGVFLFDQPTFEHTSAGLPVAVSSTFHAFVAGAIIFISTVGFPQASAQSEQPLEKIETRLVFLAQPGPGGGGGGGGLRQKAPPPRAQRKGRSRIDSPMPRREPPKQVLAPPKPPEPKRPPLDAERLPVVVAPIVVAPADARNRPGVLE